MNKQIKYFETPIDVAQAVADIVVTSASESIAKRGVFHWALAGGTTPKQCYELLRDANMDWSKVHVWFGDERCLPVGDSERNDVMADNALLKHIPVPAMNIHRIHAELGAEKAACMYTQALSTIDVLDLVLLGMGEDGHTASLFPNNPALRNKALAVPVFDAPKPPPERVSMGYTTLKSARKRLMMVTGKAKKDVFERIKQGERLPIVMGDSIWYIAL